MLQDAGILGAEHWTQGLAGHMHRYASMLGGTHRSGAFIEEPPVARIEIPSAGNNHRVHSCDRIRKFHHPLNDLLQRMQHLG